MSNNFIVCTSINAPTDAIRRFDEIPGWALIVVGDKKTPSNYALQNGVYLSPEDQRKFAPKLSRLLGWNCIQRRNIGLLLAHKLQANLVALVDDDNIPYENWGESVLVGRPNEVIEYQVKAPVFDPLSVTNYPHLWHRGFPIQLLTERSPNESSKQEVIPMVEAQLWDGDPDIDAICRFKYSPDCIFEKPLLPYTSNRPSPFNSQNTILHADVLPFYFLFPGIGRMDDIWASYFLQSFGHRVVYSQASVRQIRNAHDLAEDIEREVLGYRYSLDVIEHLAEHPGSLDPFLPQQAQMALREYQKFFD